jgi:hypothetical protein
VLSDFYKNGINDTIWWAEEGEFDGDIWMPDDGVMLFSFDKKTVFNLFRDYPWKLTAEQKAIFDRENPYWADFFRDRA